MTSEMTPMQKPAPPPKPVKYRAPPPPTSSSSVSRVTPVVKKYRAPAPPVVRPPPRPSPPSAASSAGKAAMRREPMQVLPCSVTSYERCRVQPDSGTTTTTLNDGVFSNGPRQFRVTEDACLRQREQLSQSASTVADVADRITVETEESKSDVTTVKPVIHDVKLCSRNSDVSSAVTRQRRRTVRSWRSTESLDRLITPSNASNGGGGGLVARSSFVDPASSVSTSAGRRSVYIDLGEYQTLLKHGRQDAVYSLPQPHCYGDDTLRAVKLITEKYDTFRRRQMRAMSFRDAAAVAAAAGAGGQLSRQMSSAGDDTIAEDDVRLMSESSRSVGQQHQTETTTSRADAVPPSTLSRTVLTLSRCGLDSTSSLHDATCPLEVEVADDAECGVSRIDRLRIEMFYRSHETEVYVCSCLADLFVGAVGRGAGAAGRWVHVHTGVPLWLLNTGHGRRRRELTVALAERRTGLPLWHDRITYLSNYSQADDGDVTDDTSHVMRPSSNLSSAVRISMFNRRSAAAFLDRFHRFTADPVDDLWKIGDYRSDADTSEVWPWRRRRRRRRCLNASKDSISQPCHVVLISRTDFRHPNFRAAFSHLLPSSPPPETCLAESGTAGTTSEQDEFRPRLPTR